MSINRQAIIFPDEYQEFTLFILFTTIVHCLCLFLCLYSKQNKCNKLISKRILTYIRTLFHKSPFNLEIFYIIIFYYYFYNYFITKYIEMQSWVLGRGICVTVVWNSLQFCSSRKRDDYIVVRGIDWMHEFQGRIWLAVKEGAISGGE